VQHGASDSLLGASRLRALGCRSATKRLPAYVKATRRSDMEVWLVAAGVSGAAYRWYCCCVFVRGEGAPQQTDEAVDSNDSDVRRPGGSFY
jgi:hypothetical protein